MAQRRVIRPGDGDPAHGTANGYVNLKCRCPECQTGWADYIRGRRSTDPKVSRQHKVAKQRPIVHPEPDQTEEPFVFQREPVKHVEMTGEARVQRSAEVILPWMTDRLVRLGYNPEVKVIADGDELVIRCALTLMPAEAREPGRAHQVLKEAIEWARCDPRLSCGA